MNEKKSPTLGDASWSAMKNKITELEERLSHTQDDRDVAEKRIAELEAENQQLTAALHEVDLLSYVKLESERNAAQRELAECRAMNAALVTASASGQGIEVDEVLVIYGSANNFNSTHGAYLADGYRRVGWQVLADERVAVMWQRPARPESAD